MQIISNTYFMSVFQLKFSEAFLRWCRQMINNNNVGITYIVATKDKHLIW